MESWSLLRMTVTHLLILSVSMLPLAWLMQWMPHSIFSILGYIGIFFAVYAAIWFSKYAAIKRKIAAINEYLSK